MSDDWDEGPLYSNTVARRRREIQEIDLPTEEAQRLAQIVNLQIAGYSLAQIAAGSGTTVAELERLLTKDTGTFVRTLPAMRAHARSRISGELHAMTEAVREMALNPTKIVEIDGEAVEVANDRMLDAQDRMLRNVKELAKLYGAYAPTQTEVKIENAPEAVERLIQKIAEAEGLGYDSSVFDDDIEDAEIVED